ncbi:hypothetical protein [Vagococcus sp. WN89Y]|uniref:hypothetical protein n=1 Tax=Vagococcus sp. WN89Y TaxID=3457258 RepID=UPI003FCCC90D
MQYPNAEQILEELGYIVPGIINLAAENASILAQYNDTLPEGIIKNIASSLKHIPITQNIYPALCEKLFLYFNEKIESITRQHEAILSDRNTLTRNLAQQSVSALSDVVKQLCLFRSRLNQSEEYRIENWEEMFKIYPILTKTIEIHEIHTLKVINDALLRLKKTKAHCRIDFISSTSLLFHLISFWGIFIKSEKVSSKLTLSTMP